MCIAYSSDCRSALRLYICVDSRVEHDRLPCSLLAWNLKEHSKYIDLSKRRYAGSVTYENNKPTITAHAHVLQYTNLIGSFKKERAIQLELMLRYGSQVAEPSLFMEDLLNSKIRYCLLRSYYKWNSLEVKD